MMRDYEEKPIMKAGTVSVNGTVFRIKQEDINAYCAFRPQVCASGGTRAAIIDVLKAGASTIQEPKEEETLTPPVSVEEEQNQKLNLPDLQIHRLKSMRMLHQRSLHMQLLQHTRLK